MVHDIPELIRLRALMFESMGVETDQPEQAQWRERAALVIEERFAAGTLLAVVIDSTEVDGALVSSGMASISQQLPGPTNPSGYEARISSISTDPAHRRRGHGGAVLDRLLAELDHRQVRRVELHATEDGRSLYESRGFQLRPGGTEMRLMK